MCTTTEAFTVNTVIRMTAGGDVPKWRLIATFWSCPFTTLVWRKVHKVYEEYLKRKVRHNCCIM